MATKWTKEQEKCINQKGSNLLVAAAAGSGKTAVMVERIVQRVMDKDNPVDIDRIIVVTFTKAAAAEMKGRIAARLAAELEREDLTASERSRIRRQIMLTDNANICTIDSFCNFILRNYFNTIDLDPGFRIGDSAELKLMMNDVAEEVIEEAYESGSKDFLNFSYGYITGKTDKELTSLIINLYEYAQSNVDPEGWLCSLDELYNCENAADYNNSILTKQLLLNLKSLCEGYAYQAKLLADKCLEPGYISEYAETFRADADRMMQIADAGDYDSFRAALAEKAVRLKNAPKGVDEKIKVYLKKQREKLKEKISDISKLVNLSAEDNVSYLKLTKPYVQVVSRLTLEFSRKLLEKKTQENVFSFSDVEHMALSVLLKKDENGEFTRTFVAKELSAFYSEIYIDEYQDSNQVQEYILNAVSRCEEGTGNIFMVGDIKQSIYSFRQADPKIFLDKYNTYTGDSLIVLHKNFRSSANVLTCINEIFERIMHASLGNVEYDIDARLVHNDDRADEEDTTCELLLFDSSKDSEANLDDSSDEETVEEITYDGMNDNSKTKSEEDTDIVTKEELTKECKMAKVIALRINELVKQGAHYRDIVILLRNPNVIGSAYVKVLTEASIPAICTSTSGYFNAKEIKMIMDFLTVLDNPRQDIPLAAVLRSYFCFLSAEELAHLRGAYKELSLYDCVIKFMADDFGQSENRSMLRATQAKLESLMALLDKYRRLASYLPIHELIRRIIYDTDYITYVCGMNMGKVRQANLLMLINKAEAFESTSYHGLFNFLRYIEKMAKYNVESDGANVLSENDDVVRIMSIHKSKGLEFPIVFLSGADKKFRENSNKTPFWYSSDYKLGMDYVDVKKRIRYKHNYKKALNIALRTQQIGEELRLLYVALTRAEAKFIVVGNVTDLEEKELMWTERANQNQGDYLYVYEKRNYLDYVAPMFYKTVTTGNYSRRVFTAADFGLNVAEDTEVSSQEKVLEELSKLPVEKDLIDNLKNRFSFVYAHSAAVKMPGKFSVSEIKHEFIDASDDQSVRLTQNPDTEKKTATRKKGSSKAEKPNADTTNADATNADATNADVTSSGTAAASSGAERGNAYHKFFEILDYSIPVSEKSLKAYLDECVEKDLISKEYASYLNLKKFVAFMKSPLGLRMKEAALSGKMRREQQFVAGFRPKQLKDSFEVDDETILLQGIIDCYFEEDNELVVVDYKTDAVPKDREDILLSRYTRQLELYRDAISKMTGISVKECVIYSVCLNKEIVVWKSKLDTTSEDNK